MKKAILSGLLLSVLAVIPSCNKITTQRGRHASSNTLEVKERADWSIEYRGRDDQKIGGAMTRVERFSVDVAGAEYYIVRTITPDDLSSFYGNDLAKFFKDESDYMLEDATNYNENVTDYMETNTRQDMVFSLLRHGEYFAFAIAFNAKGKPTGEYASCNFFVREDEPSGEFERWLGDWTISGGGKSYPLTITSTEANYSYRIEGWETGDDIAEDGEQMNQEDFEAFFEPSNGSLVFVSQYIQSYKDGDDTLDEFFLGSYTYDGSRHDKGDYIVEDEGLDLAIARMGDDLSSATVEGCGVTVLLDNDEFKTEINMMKYYCTEGNYWYHYNGDVPYLPLTMTRTASAPSARSMKTVSRPRTRESLRHERLRKPGRTNVARRVRKIS